MGVSFCSYKINSFGCLIKPVSVRSVATTGNIFESVFISDKSKTLIPITMPPKSNNQKKKEAEAAGKPPKLTKQQENAGKSSKQKKAETQAKRAADKEKKTGGW